MMIQDMHLQIFRSMIEHLISENNDYKKANQELTTKLDELNKKIGELEKFKHTNLIFRNRSRNINRNNCINDNDNGNEYKRKYFKLKLKYNEYNEMFENNPELKRLAPLLKEYKMKNFKQILSDKNMVISAKDLVIDKISKEIKDLTEQNTKLKQRISLYEDYSKSLS